MKISVIIPNYNGEELLKKNIPSVCSAVEYWSKQTKSEAEIIVVDDASTDASASVISNSKYQIANIKYVTNKRNVGFSSTVNRGVKEAKGEIIILLNTDVSPEKDFLVSLLGHFENPKVFGVGCLDKSVEGDKVVERGRGVGRWQRGFLVHGRGDVDKKNTLWVSGGSSAFRKSIWDKLGGFNPLYNPFYWEDIDLSYRALKSGYLLLFEHKSIVTHEHEKGAIRARFSKNEITAIAYRNQLLFVWLNADKATLLIHVAWMPYHIISAAVRGDIAFLKGLIHASFSLFQVVSYRKKTGALFVKTDKQVVEGLYEK